MYYKNIREQQQKSQNRKMTAITTPAPPLWHTNLNLKQSNAMKIINPKKKAKNLFDQKL